MAYTTINFKTKKALKESLAKGQVISVFQPNGDLFNHHFREGEIITLEGPHFPEPHKWYARARIVEDKAHGCFVIEKLLNG